MHPYPVYQETNRVHNLPSTAFSFQTPKHHFAEAQRKQPLSATMSVPRPSILKYTKNHKPEPYRLGDVRGVDILSLDSHSFVVIFNEKRSIMGFVPQCKELTTMARDFATKFAADRKVDDQIQENTRTYLTLLVVADHDYKDDVQMSIVKKFEASFRKEGYEFFSDRVIKIYYDAGDFDQANADVNLHVRFASTWPVYIFATKKGAQQQQEGQTKVELKKDKTYYVHNEDSLEIHGRT